MSTKNSDLPDTATSHQAPIDGLPDGSLLTPLVSTVNTDLPDTATSHQAPVDGPPDGSLLTRLVSTMNADLPDTATSHQAPLDGLLDGQLTPPAYFIIGILINSLTSMMSLRAGGFLSITMTPSLAKYPHSMGPPLSKGIGGPYPPAHRRSLQKVRCHLLYHKRHSNAVLR